MKFFAVVPALLAAAAAEAQLPIAPQFLGQAGLYRGYSGYGAVPAVPYASAYSAPVNFAYGAEITALNAAPAPAQLEALPTYGFGENNGYGAPSAPVIAAPQAAVAYAAAPVIAEAVPAPVIAKAAAIAPIASHSSQYQAQDEQRNFAYGYQNINSAKQETGNAYGGVTGSYSYADEAGVHTTHYVADNLGFRVSADNLPVAPVHNAVLPVAPVHHAALPVAPVHVAEPVVDTPAVVEAKAAFFKAYNAEKSRVVKRSVRPQTYAAFNPAYNFAGYQPYSYSAPLAYNYNNYNNYPAAPFTTAYAAAAPAVAAPLAYAGVSPLNYAAAAGAPLREATLTTIKLNPGHATFYRVD